MEETRQKKSEAVEILEKLSDKIAEYGKSFESLKENLDNVVAELRGLNLSPVAEAEIAEIKELKEAAFHLAKLNTLNILMAILMAVAFMQSFRNLAERILEKVEDGEKELIERSEKIKKDIKELIKLK